MQNIIERQKENNVSIATDLLAAVHYGACVLTYFNGGVQWAELTAGFQRCVALYQEMGDQYGIAASVASLGLVELQQDNIDAAVAYHEKLLSITALDDAWTRIGILVLEAGIAQRQGNIAQARTAYEEVINNIKQFGEERQVLCHAFGYLQNISNPKEALAIAQERLVLALDLKGNLLILSCLHDIGRLLIIRQRWTQAALVLGAAEALQEIIGQPDNKKKEEWPINLQNAIEEAWKRGRTLTPERVFALLQSE